MRKSDLKVGSVIVADYNYGACRYYFYKIERITNDFVWLYQIGKEYISGAINSIVSTVKPKDTGYTGKMLRRKIKGSDDSCWISIDDYIGAYAVYIDGRTYQEQCD